jgi:hypothetical protein
MADRVLVILTNYSRPQNMPRVIQAWRDQTVKCKIVVADNSPPEMYQETYPKYLLSGDGYDAPDDVWRWTENSGCPCWLGPAAMLSHKYEYIIRADDDFLPGKRAVEHLLRTASICNYDFSTIGQIGRIFDERGYNRGNVPQRSLDEYEMRRYELRRHQMIQVDLTCRVSMMKAENVLHVLDFRQRLVNTGEPDAARLVDIHDDFLACMGIQLAMDDPSYIISTTDDPETQLAKTEIPNGAESVYKRPGHYEERSRMVELSRMVGWRSVTRP